MKKILLIMVAIALLLCGCAKELPAYELPSESTAPNESVETTPAQEKEWEEFNTYPAELDVDKLLGHTDHEIVFLQGLYAHYYDFDMHRAFAFCSQPNCTHSDESCPAYFGGESVMETDYAVSGDSVYAILTENQRTVRLRQLRPLTGEKRDLFSESLPETVNDQDENGVPRTVSYDIQRVDLLLSGSALILQYEIWRDETRFETDRQAYSRSAEKVILRYDLRDGTLRELYRSPIPLLLDGSVALPAETILDASDRYALLLPSVLPDTAPMTMEEYMETGADEEAYHVYLAEMMHSFNMSNELQVWDLETGEKTSLCTLNDLRMDSDSALYQHKICYIRGERELWQLDLRDGSRRKLLEVEAPANFTVFEQWDGRVFFSRWRELADGTGWTDWFWYEPAAGELRQYQADSSLLQYRILGETDRSFYVSRAGGGYYLIDKQDYYNENYGAAQKVGMLSLVN